MSGPRKPTAYDAFSTVDSLVSKPVMGSDGAASWQKFQASTKSKQTKSRNVAPHIPLKRTDKLTGMKSIEEERKNEENLRKIGGDRKMGGGYTLFKRKGHDRDEIADRKRLKMVEERKKPEDKKYFIKAATFAGWKEDYVFTTRERGTGYYWDGMDSVKRLVKGNSMSTSSVATDTIDGAGEAAQVSKESKKKKKKKDKKAKMDSSATQSLPNGWAEALDPTSGRTYYYNVSLNKTVWERPTNEKTESGDVKGDIISDGGKPLENGWEEAKDPTTGKIYYFNRSLNKTTWERPC